MSRLSRRERDFFDGFTLSLKKERQMWAHAIRRNNITLE
jgi:hypothetical protein